MAIAAACVGLTMAACGGGDESSSDEADGSAATTAADETKQNGGGAKAAGAGTGSLVEVSDSEFGQILTDADGRTLYLFDKEATDRSECFGACEEAWPVLFTEGDPAAGSGVKESLLGTTEHEGKTQVTYNGHPLYYYAHEGPGEVLCQGVDEFGGLWLVVDPGGDAIQ